MAKILIIDDDELLCEALIELLSRKNHAVTAVHTCADGLRECTEDGYDVVLLDVILPDGEGIEIIPELKKAASEPEVIIITGWASGTSAETALKKGAWCYMEKVSITRELLLPLTRLLEYRNEKIRNTHPRLLNRDALIGSSLQLQKCLQLVASAATNDVNVLITGETGTGKEVFASIIHQNSPRAGGGSFVVVDCTVLPDTLVESILFGHAKGAFTGADRQRKGLVQQADGGTLFLDEIGELPLSMQKSFLRVLEERCFRPVGSAEVTRSDFRLIAATNRDLDTMVSEGRFREDLLFRLRSLSIELPPLRERGNDIQELANYYIEKICTRHGCAVKSFSPEFVEALKEYSWPGNVRELFLALERVFVTASGCKSFYPLHLPMNIRVHLARSGLKTHHDRNARKVRSRSLQLTNWKEFKHNAENEYLTMLMLKTNNNIADACQLSGLSRARLYQLINKHSLQLGQPGRS